MRGEAVFGLVFGLIVLAIVVLMIVSLWKIFEKANKPGWAAIVPFYNYMIMGQVAGKPEAWGY